MSGPAVILREIHRLRKHLKDLQGEIDRLPRLLKGQQTKVTRQEEAAVQAHETLKHLKVTIREKEGLIKETQQLAIKHERQMNEASSKKEYDALKQEIAHDKQKCLQLEDEILRTLLEIDERTAQLPEADRAVEQARREFSEFEKSNASRQASLVEQLQQAQQSLKEVEATLPADVRSQFDRQVAARGDDALSAVDGRTCVACYTEITAQNYNELRQEVFVQCKSCGRILYLPD
jgi:predicted  nucleic acid-binding Zn-ribbon protein